MQNTHLTTDGIDCMFAGDVVILQIIDSSVQSTSSIETEEFLQATLSDGFAFIRKAWIPMKYFPDRNYQFSVIKMRTTLEKGKKRPNGPTPSFIVTPYEFQILFSGLKQSIGKPISYRDYVNNGRVNHDGCRQIPIAEESDDDFDLVTSNIGIKEQQKKQQPQKKVNKPKKAIEPIPEKKRNSIKPEIKNEHSDAEKIKDLFLGLENFKIVARLLFIWPIKAITTKKGNQSELLSLEFGDSTGTIMASVFGESANKYSTLEPGKVYGITGAMLTENSFRGKTELKLLLNEQTKVMMLDNSLAPKLETFCVSVQGLSNAEKGQVLTPICFVREGQLEEFISKAGNKVIKKILNIYDLEHQVCAELTLFGDKATASYEEGMYALRGVEVDQFQGNKQFKASLSFLAMPLPRHPLSKHIQKVDDMDFATLNSNKKQNKTLIDNFAEVLQKSEHLHEKESIWSEVVCYLKGVRHGSGKTMYLSCPKCKKKVTDENESHCIHCDEFYSKAKYRYILNVNLIDAHDNLWASSYDEIAERLLALDNEECFPADKFNELSDEQVKNRLHELRFKKVKVKIVSAKEQFGGQLRLKHKIIKLLDIDYEQECQSMMKKIQKSLS